MNKFKITLFKLLVLISVFSVFGNDGTYLTRGGIIYPTQETKITLEKEDLFFSVKNGIAHVEIKFEFHNPDNSDRKLLVGFQAPTAGGDVSESVVNTNQINNFTVLQNGQILPYSLKAAECEDCELRSPEELHFSQSTDGIFVFLFEITFKPGLNQINHSYNFPASGNVIMREFYNYILTTGSKWAGGKIKDLTINIDMGQNQYFYVHDIFGPSANWSIIGTGKVTDKSFKYVNDDSFRMVRTISGQLQIKVADFIPTKNIEFGIINQHSFSTYPVFEENNKEDRIISITELSATSNYSKRELRIMRNAIYAKHGYNFSSPDLKKYFSQFAWYIPDPNLKMDHIKLTLKESEFLEAIIMKEKTAQK